MASGGGNVRFVARTGFGWGVLPYSFGWNVVAEGLEAPDNVWAGSVGETKGENRCGGGRGFSVGREPASI